jgi:hypothetical protein
MKRIILIILSLVSINCHAEHITCFSHSGRIIYDQNVHDVRTTEGFYVFKELDTGKIVYIRGECVVKFRHHR